MYFQQGILILKKGNKMWAKLYFLFFIVCAQSRRSWLWLYFKHACLSKRTHAIATHLVEPTKYVSLHCFIWPTANWIYKFEIAEFLNKWNTNYENQPKVWNYIENKDVVPVLLLEHFRPLNVCDWALKLTLMEAGYTKMGWYVLSYGTLFGMVQKRRPASSVQSFTLNAGAFACTGKQHQSSVLPMEWELTLFHH